MKKELHYQSLCKNKHNARVLVNVMQQKDIASVIMLKKSPHKQAIIKQPRTN